MLSYDLLYVGCWDYGTIKWELPGWLLYSFFFLFELNYTINLHPFYFKKWWVQNGEHRWKIQVLSDSLGWDGDLSSLMSSIGHKSTLMVLVLPCLFQTLCMAPIFFFFFFGFESILASIFLANTRLHRPNIKLGCLVL